MKIDLIKIEDKLKDFFEKDLKIVAHRNPLQNLSNQLIVSLEKNLNTIDSQTFAPNIFRISIKEKDFINKSDLAEWKKYIQEIIKEIARDNSFQFAGPIHIQIFCKPKITSDFKITVASSSISSGKTVNLFSKDKSARKPEKSLDGYLITSDESYHPIKKAIFNIGRRNDNDLVIDNLRVSRVHAQIRQINNKHVIFDLDSTTGTMVNNVKIRQHILNPGDVIEFADIPVIYGNDMDAFQSGENNNKTRTLAPQKSQDPKK